MGLAPVLSPIMSPREGAEETNKLKEREPRPKPACSGSGWEVAPDGVSAFDSRVSESESAAPFKHVGASYPRVRVVAGAAAGQWALPQSLTPPCSETGLQCHRGLCS